MIKLFFFGAGASKPFGIPTMQELTEKAMGILRERDEVLAKRIRDKLLAGGFKLDFENIYTILEAQVNPSKGLKEAGPYAAYIHGDYEKHTKKEELNEVLLQLKKMIFVSCSISRETMKKVELQYDTLFDSLKNHWDWYKVKTFHGKINIQLDQRIVTTNYDMSLELYFRVKRKLIVDGFKDTADRYVKEFYPSVYRTNPQRTWLIKLHGSIWQFWFRNEIIKTIEDPNTSSLPIEREREMMIYPSKEKPILRNPYFRTYEIFKNELWNRLIVIGYSFRDDPVNTAILDNMILNPKSRLIVVDPYADDTLKNSPEELQSFKEQGRIILINRNIQHERTIEDLLKTLQYDVQVANNLFYDNTIERYFSR